MSTSETRFQQTNAALRNQQASIQNLENQIGQISKMMTERQLGTLPSNTESNPREHVKAVTLLEDSGRKDGVSKVMEPEKIEARKKSPLREYQPPIPYPARLKQEKVDQQFIKFLDLFKKLRINLPFVEAISQMPKYVKFLKEILSHNRKLEDLAIVTLSEECSAILQNKLLKKKRDPWSFTIPCVIGDLTISNALADLGARINLMSYNLFTKLGLGEMKPTRMSIQLVDRTVKYHRGIVEDVIVKVDKFIFPIDFMIMDMDGESNIPLILGRPFLATSRAIIDVCDRKIKLMLQEILLNDPLRVALQAEDEHELSNESVLEQLTFFLANEPSKNTDKFIEIDRASGATTTQTEPGHEGSGLKVVVPKNGGYFEIPIAPEDQEKTIFTCLYGRMPFGFYNTFFLQQQIADWYQLNAISFRLGGRQF
ncbi:uncharacterized protein LOC125369328 [Ricinus communis]|uniref:uncharacterized protein LOC125369328 n=1 Tax=Ricinus communis TaxID=3988 RepID=UPI00201AC379|nr:uncharacterized protein LOC125369328 [Ricinus communis]